MKALGRVVAVEGMVSNRHGGCQWPAWLAGSEAVSGSLVGRCLVRGQSSPHSRLDL